MFGTLNETERLDCWHSSLWVEKSYDRIMLPKCVNLLVLFVVGSRDLLKAVFIVNLCSKLLQIIINSVLSINYGL